MAEGQSVDLDSQSQVALSPFKHVTLLRTLETLFRCESKWLSEEGAFCVY
jgi:hypothetical protein